MDVFRTFATARGCGAALLNVVRPSWYDCVGGDLGWTIYCRNHGFLLTQLWGYGVFSLKKMVNQLDYGSCGMLWMFVPSMTGIIVVDQIQDQVETVFCSNSYSLFSSEVELKTGFQ